MAYSAANRKDIRAAEKTAVLVATNDAEAVTAIMATNPGRAWMWRQLSAAHIFEPNVIPDIRLASIWDGERNFGLRLLADIMLHCPESYLQMTREANERHISNDHRPASGPDDSGPDSLAERRSGPQPDGGDLGPDGGSAEGPEPSAEAGGWNLLGPQASGAKAG